MIPPENIKDMGPEDLAEVVEEAEKMRGQGLKDEDAFEKALEAVRQRRLQEKGKYGVDLHRP
ncbi:MAG TPA: hypothetical protein VFV50_03210 [Bdellovibrionales bacterium]|nr:hypothetical protein [Bdellovibrionales bacterium]